MAQPLSNLPVGAKVKSPNARYNGVPIIWLIGHKTANRVKLITEKIITLKCFDAKEPSNPNSDRQQFGNNRYSVSNIDQWLNSAAFPITPLTASGTTVEYDRPFGTKITSIVVTGKTTQEGTGDPSPDNVRPIHGVTYTEKWEGTLVGNRNLLLNSATIPGLHGWCSTVTTPAVDQGNGFYRIPLNSNVTEILQDSAVTTVKGNQYTESFYFRTDSTTLSFYITFFEKNNNKHNNVKATIQNLGNGLYRAYATATVGDTAIRAIDVGLITFADGTYIDIGMPKFESGTIVTDYSVAPEDLPSYQKIALPQPLYSLPNGVFDTFDAVTGAGTQKVGIKTLDGTEAWSANSPWDTQAPDYLHVYTRINDRTPTSRVLSSHFPTVYAWSGNLSGNFIYSEKGNAIYIFIQKALLPTPDIAGLKSWLAAHPVTVLYELATPQTITGTPQCIFTEGHTVITNDADAQMQVSGDFTWYSKRHDYDTPPTNENVWSNYNEYDNEAGFLSNFEESFRNAILDTTIRVVKSSVDGEGYEDITRKVYLLSKTEVGLGNENGVAEGTVWDYFNSASRRQAYPTAEAVSRSEYTSSSLNASSPWYWWLRTPQSWSACPVRGVYTDGTSDITNAYYGFHGVRPALELPSSVLVSDTTDADGCYTILWWTPPNMTFNINDARKAYDNGWCKINGALKQIDRVWVKVNGVLREV